MPTGRGGREKLKKIRNTLVTIGTEIEWWMNRAERVIKLLVLSH